MSCRREECLYTEAPNLGRFGFYPLNKLFAFLHALISPQQKQAPADLPCLVQAARSAEGIQTRADSSTKDLGQALVLETGSEADLPTADSVRILPLAGNLKVVGDFVLLVQVTCAPTGTVIVAGVKAKLLISISAPAAGGGADGRASPRTLIL